jgi:hypothetical protein
MENIKKLKGLPAALSLVKSDIAKIEEAMPLAQRENKTAQKECSKIAHLLVRHARLVKKTIKEAGPYEKKFAPKQ